MMRFYEQWQTLGVEPARALRDAQAWLRDTTNAEKTAWCESHMPEFGGRRGYLSKAVDGAYEALRWRSPQEREFVSPRY